MEPQRLIPGDSTLVENIVNYLKAKGIFDEFRHECLADVDTKSSCQNLSQRVDGYASKFLANETWHPELNKNELRNKLRRHMDESGMLAIGADHVVEQVINPKIHQLFLPKIIEVVHQYMKEQSEILNKKPEASAIDNTSSENASDVPDSNKAKASVSDPIADILSFSYSKTKPTPGSSTHGKTDNALQKHTDLIKVEKKKEEKNSTILEKNVLESPNESHSNPVVTEVKPQIDKEKDKIKKEEPEVSPEAPKKVVKEEIKQEKKKIEETKTQISELSIQTEENKTNVPPVKSNVSGKKDVDKNKQKPKLGNTHKSSGISSDVKKTKKESLEKSTEKQSKSKLLKSSKEASSPTKSVSSVKSISKEGSEVSKSKPSDGSISKTSESSQKKASKSNSNKTDGSSKHKNNSEKSEKSKISKSSDKNEQNQESANIEKGVKNTLYSSSYDSSQGSDQEKSSSSSSKKERQKYFSKHTKKESSEKHSDKNSKSFPYKRHSKEADNSTLKKQKNEKNEKFKETVIVGEAAKISSRSNSFGSTSSVSSSSNTSKDNLISNSDEASENSKKDKKNKQTKEKEPCHVSKTLPPPPPPPPPSSSLSCELTSSAEVSSIEDTQSSSNSENSSSEELSEQSSSDSEVESKESILNTLNESLINSSTDDINDFYDIFLYSSSSSEFEGFGDSPDKKRTVSVLEKINESDISVSSVHTSDLSSYDDELSDDDFYGNESQPGIKKRLTLKEAKELIQKRSFLQSFDENKNISRANKSDETATTFNKRTAERSSSLLSSDDESSPSEPKRSLRRERKLNPRYASSEYTSIFNSRKETFITKQSTPYSKNQTPNSSPNNEGKFKKESAVEKDRSLKKNSVETRIVKIHQDNAERSHKTKRKVYTSTHLEQDKEFSDSSQISMSDEMDSITNKEKLFSENNESNNVISSELKLQIKLKPQSISNYTINSYPVKRKLKDAESIPPKRPCSRGSVDSSSSECVPNENKPFNSEKQDMPEEKAIRDVDIKVSEFADAIKKELFCKQRTNNNGDILGQKDIFPIHSHGKSLSTPERKTSETENSKELSAL